MSLHFFYHYQLEIFFFPTPKDTISQGSLLREDILNRLIFTVISKQNEVKDTIRAAFGQIVVLIEEMRQVGEMRILKKNSEHYLRQENTPFKAQVESTCTSVNQERWPIFAEQEKLAHDLFANNFFF